MAETKAKATRTGHLVKLEIFIPAKDNSPDSMIHTAHLIKRVEGLKLDAGDIDLLEIIAKKTKHCQQFAGKPE